MSISREFRRMLPLRSDRSQFLWSLRSSHMPFLPAMRIQRNQNVIRARVQKCRSVITWALRNLKAEISANVTPPINTTSTKERLPSVVTLKMQQKDIIYWACIWKCGNWGTLAVPSLTALLYLHITNADILQKRQLMSFSCRTILLLTQEKLTMYSTHYWGKVINSISKFDLHSKYRATEKTKWNKKRRFKQNFWDI